MTTMNTANDNTSADTTTLDIVVRVMVATFGPEHRWALEGWAAHLRPTRHQKHVVASYLKHAHEFGDAHEGALALAIARCVDFGVAAEAAREMIDTTREARDAKAGAA